MQTTLDNNNATNDFHSISSMSQSALRVTHGGGAIFASGSSVIILSSLFSNNTALALGFGGAIFAKNSVLDLSSNLFQGNWAISGGAIHSQMGSDVQIDGCWCVGGCLTVWNGILDCLKVCISSLYALLPVSC